jgi:hypothetical protein
MRKYNQEYGILAIAALYLPINLLSVNEIFSGMPEKRCVADNCNV